MEALTPPMSERWELLQAYGLGSLSFHTMQAGLGYFDCFPDGFAAYKDYGGHRFALSDPVCSRFKTRELLERFDGTHPSITFFHITEATADALDAMGYYVNEMGEEGIIDIPTHSWSGRDKEDIRHLHNAARKHGVEAREIYGDGRIYEEARETSRVWLEKVKKRAGEMWFLTRRPVYADYPGVRRFYAFEKGKMTGFIYFDPVCAGGRAQGYCPSILRRRPEAAEGTLDWIIRVAMEKFREEGVAKLYLGLMPAYRIEDDVRRRYRHSRFTMKLFRFSYRSRAANRVYRFKSLSFHKLRYRAPTRKVYMATRSAIPVKELFLAGRMMGVI